MAFLHLFSIDAIQMVNAQCKVEKNSIFSKKMIESKFICYWLVYWIDVNKQKYIIKLKFVQ